MKRALIITYYWPPAGGPGVQRWLHFVRYLKEFEVEPIVYVPENAHYPLIDESFTDFVPTDIEILKQPIKEPYKMASLFSKKKTKTISSGIISKKKQSLAEKLLLYIRGNFFIPDARIGWVKPSFIFLKNYLAENPVDVIISSGPPHSLHLIGLRLQNEIGVKWIADFRDPWTTIHYHKSLKLTKSSEAKHKKLESQILNSADKIIVTSPTTKKEFEAITNKPIEVITNGYELSGKIESELDEKFTIAHIGSLLSERNPNMLWKVLSEIVSENKDFKNDFELKLAGTVSEDVLNSIKTFGLNNNLNLLGYVSHSEAIKLQHNAQVLLVLEIDKPETRAIIPGKIFEYLAAKRPIIALGPKESDIEYILEETQSGHFFSDEQETKLKNYILSLYRDYKKDGVFVISNNIEKFSRKNLSEKLADLLKSI